MDKRQINGKDFKQFLVYGLASLKKHIDIVNDLNVFPIPDGDTGDNMYSTLSGGVKALNNNDDESLQSVADSVGSGMLLGARGNSGVILSQMFGGITAYLSQFSTVGVKDLANAFKCGVEHAYASVSQPVEGTMLTVLREATEVASKKIDDNSTIESFLSDYLNETHASLDRTPELLPVLKEAGVVDSGGAGVLHIMEGFLQAVRGEDLAMDEVAVTSTAKEIDFSLFNENSVMKYGYCTEFLLQLTHAKTDIDSFSLEEMKAKLSTFGDSLVAVRTGTVIKIHVHTLTPGDVLAYAQGFGEFLTLKIENMTLQHNETVENKPTQTFKKNAVRKKYGVVTVGNGEGIINTFKEMGADIVIDGGQGKNPSVETFLQAFEAVNCDNIVVFPNNGNIVMAAKEAGENFKGSNVFVVNSKTLGDGYTGLSAIDFSGDDIEEVLSAIEEEISASECLMVSKAIRDTVSSGVEIRNGDYIGFVGKDILLDNANKVDCAISLADKMNVKNRDFLIVFYGADVSDSDKQAFEKEVSKNYKNVEFYGIDGGQDVYEFIMILQ